jgi:hypothetical protein
MSTRAAPISPMSPMPDAVEREHDDARAVLARARAAGLTLEAAGDRLRWCGPLPAAELLDDLRAHKAELLAALAVVDAPADAALTVAVVERPTACEARRDAIEHGERDDEGDATEPPLPPPGTPEREALDARQRETVAGLLGAASQRPPSWGNPAAVPSPGCWCSCCHGTRWWTEREGSKGWRCGKCYPPIHLHADAVRWAAVVISSIKDTRTCFSP